MRPVDRGKFFCRFGQTNRRLSASRFMELAQATMIHVRYDECGISASMKISIGNRDPRRRDRSESPGFSLNTVQLVARMVMMGGPVGCGQAVWWARFAAHFKTLRLTTLGLERLRRMWLRR